MKTYWLLCLLVVAVQRPSFAQQRPAAQAKTYTFVPETVYPLGGRAMQVTAVFRLSITPDTVVAYLPYFGDARVTDYGNNKGPGDFTLVKFDYTEQKGKRGSTVLRILPKDNGDVRQIELTYYPGSVYADVNILFNKRQPIAYRGQLKITGAAIR